MTRRAIDDLKEDFETADQPNQSEFRDLIDTFQGMSVQIPVKDKDTLTPPGSPITGDRYLINGTGAGGWVGEDNNIAEWDGTAWRYDSVFDGMMCYALDEDALYVYNGSSWSAYLSGAGDINQGGNSFGAAVTIGSNDGYAMNFETNSVTRLSLSTSGNLDFTATDFFLTADTADGSDTKAIFISGGGSVSGNLRGGYGIFYGNEYADPVLNGSVDIQAGAVTNGTVDINAPDASGIVTLAAAGAPKLRVDGTNGVKINNAYNMPAADASTANDVMVSNAAGVLSFATMNLANVAAVSVGTAGQTFALDSSSSMIIENSGGTDLLTVDGTNNRIHVGPVTGSFLCNIGVSDSSAVNMQFHNSTTGSGATDGFLVGLDASEIAQLVNFEATNMVFKTEDITCMVLGGDDQIVSIHHDLLVYGYNAGDSKYRGTYDKTEKLNVANNTTQDLIRILKTDEATVIAGTFSFHVYISVIRNHGTVTEESWIYKWGWANGGSADFLWEEQTSNGTTGASFASAADGSGQKLTVTTDNSGDDADIVVRIVGQVLEA